MKFVKKFLTSPITVLSSIVVGIIAGVLYPQDSQIFEGVGNIYISLLKVVVLPFLLATILVGIVGLLQRDGAASMIKKIIAGFFISMVLASAIGIASVTFTSGEMTAEKKVLLGSLVSSQDSASNETQMTLQYIPTPVAKQDPFAMFGKFIPENIFSALNTGESLKVVIFCLIFGISLGQIRGAGQQVIVDVLKTIQQASISIFKFLNYFLPFALMAMISSQVGKVGLSIFQMMFEFIGQQTLGGVAIMVTATLVLWWRSNTSIIQVINEVKQTLIVAISSRSALACIPYAQDALTKLRFDASSVELMVPLSFTVNRIGSITYYAISTLFIANVYGVALGASGLAVVLFGSILAGLASAGTTGVLTVATVAIVCDLLALPHEAVIVLLIAVDPVMDMIRTAVHVYGNMAVTSYVCEKPEHQ
jgi:proton glutamate symport protein